MIRNLFILLLFVSAFNESNAQSKWHYSIELEPIYSYRTYAIGDYSRRGDGVPSGDAIYDFFKDMHDSGEKPKFGYGMTLGVGYDLTDKISINSGLGYKNIGERADSHLYQPGYQFGGVITVYYPEENPYNPKNSYHYLSLPFEINHKVAKRRKTTLAILAGTDIDYLLASKISSYSPYSSYDLKKEFGHVSKFALNLNMGFLIGYRVSDNASFFIKPQFSRYITPNVKYNIHVDDIYCHIKQYNYYGQLNVGLQFK